MKLISAILLSMLATAALADEGTISLSPSVVTLRGEQGQATTQRLTLTNTTSRTFSFDLVAQDVVTRNGKRVFVDAGAMSGSIAATAVFSHNHVEIPAGESRSVSVTVTIPPHTANRAVVALFRGTDRILNGRVPMQASLGTLLTFTLSDGVAMDTAPLRIRPQSATANLAVWHACTNSGSEPVVARGMIAVVDASGALAGKAAIEPRRLLPGESADFGGEYGGDLAPGHYRVLVTYDYEGRVATRAGEVVIQ